MQKSGLTTPGVSLSAVPLLHNSDFQDVLTSYIGQPLTFKGLNEITGNVSAFYKRQDHPLVDVVAPEQDVATGVIQIVVNEFYVGEVPRRAIAGSPTASSARPSPFNMATPLTPKRSSAISTPPTPTRSATVYQPSSQPGYTDLGRLPFGVPNSISVQTKNF